MSGIYEEWHGLTVAEQLLLTAHPLNALIIKQSKPTAFAEAKKRFGINGHNDSSDAFRHCFWAAILARDIGYLDAWAFTTAHESAPGNPADEKAMDLHNNSVGLNLGSYWFIADSNAELSNMCYEAYQKGELKSLQ
jgi:hypothetical protein